MSYVGLDGQHESFADTLRNWFYQNWPEHIDKPKFVSPGGIDNIQTILKENDWKAIQKDQASYVEFSQSDTEVLEATNSFTYAKSHVIIDVYGEYKAEFVSGIIDSMLINDYKPEFLKTDGLTSSILQTQEYALDWTVIKKQPDAGIVLQYSAEIALFWQKNKT